MSRVAKKPVELAKGVSAEVQGQTVPKKGAKGSLALNVNTEVEVQVDGSATVKVEARRAARSRTRRGHDAR
jgi:large subunit ribosomal protein L6